MRDIPMNFEFTFSRRETGPGNRLVRDWLAASIFQNRPEDFNACVFLPLPRARNQLAARTGACSPGTVIGTAQGYGSVSGPWRYGLTPLHCRGRLSLRRFAREPR